MRSSIFAFVFIAALVSLPNSAEATAPICRNCWDVPCPADCTACVKCMNCVEISCDGIVTTKPKAAAQRSPDKGPQSTRPGVTPVLGGGLLEQGGGFSPGGPAATGAPVAPRAPAGQVIK